MEKIKGTFYLKNSVVITVIRDVPNCYKAEEYKDRLVDSIHSLMSDSFCSYITFDCLTIRASDISAAKYEVVDV